MRRRPNRELTEEQEEAADEFISGASESPPSTTTSDQETNRQQTGEERAEPGPQNPTYPWEESHVREDVKQTYPLRLPEPLHLKLKFLSEKTGKSMNELCNEAVREMVEGRLDELL